MMIYKFRWDSGEKAAEKATEVVRPVEAPSHQREH